MYMFLPFLIALLSSISIFFGKKRTGFWLWGLLLIVSLVWFNYHSTDLLNLSF
ncbi:hypothetical protein C4K04_3831 [Pseudomonas chlororaphis]|uniref:Uncharacterized protein n=1 Tax=Pseudomonas chlororaphis TaxID=587753 RepID=A0A3G7TRJ8_9PSED|nr:hypothetical protein C4K04_3831 [Pseudomonas chlororaphis]